MCLDTICDFHLLCLWSVCVRLVYNNLNTFCFAEVGTVDEGLSGGAIAGIVIAVLVAVIILACIIKCKKKSGTEWV